MSSNLIQSEIQDAYSQIADRMDGFRKRYTQRRLIADIYNTVTSKDANSKILVAEGPTGTGKTLAYLLAGIPIAKHLDKTLLISSATVALQSQIIEKDLPFVANNSGLEFTYAIAKGRGRYLCPTLLSQQIGPDHNQPSFFTEISYLELFQSLQQEFLDGSWQGDRDSWPEYISDDLWVKISNDRHGCRAARCHNFSICPYFLARAELENADVIVANHDLVLSDLSLGGGILLPSPENSIYIFDEAHQLPDKTINHSGNWLSISGNLSWIEKAEKSLTHVESIMLDVDTVNLFSPAFDNLKQLNMKLVELQQSCAQIPTLSQAEQNESTHRFEQGIVPENLLIQSKELFLISQSLLSQFSRIRDRLDKAVSDQEIVEVVADSVLPEMGIHIGRLEGVTDLFSKFMTIDDDKAPPNARWITHSNFNEHQDYRLHCFPISAQNFLQEKLWNHCFAAILTSATLVSLGSFHYFQTKSGLSAIIDAKYLQLASPFNYHEKATLWIPAMLHEPQQIEAHTAEITRLLAEIIVPMTGTLVLFSSRKQLTDVYDGLPAQLSDQVLVQGHLTTSALLENHRAKITNGETSVIFGLASFAEGIDLPGNLCTHVIIAKLPFAVPDSPIEATEREYVESLGKNHFREIVLPQTCIKLIQAAGRLLRSEEDSGKVTILDRRLVTKSYGKAFLQSLPNMKRVIDVHSSNSLQTESASA